MHPTISLLLAAAAPLAVAGQTTDDDYMDYQVTQELVGMYGTDIPAAATGAAATSLAAAIYNEEQELVDDEGYIDAASAIYMAMATQTNSNEILASMEVQGYLHTEKYTTSEWYSTGVPASAQTAWASVIDKFHAVETSALAAAATATGTEVTWYYETAYGTETSVSYPDDGFDTITTVPSSASKATASSAQITSAATTTAGASGSSATDAAATTSPVTAGAMGARPTGAAVAGMAAVIAAGAAVFY